MNRQQAKYVTVISIVIMLAVQYFIRPNYHYFNWIKTGMGCMPNFLSAIFVPAIFFILIEKIQNRISFKNLLLLHVIIVGMLCSYELLQMITFFGKTFDKLDIISTFAGSAISICLLLPWAGKASIINFSIKPQEEAITQAA